MKSIYILPAVLLCSFNGAAQVTFQKTYTTPGMFVTQGTDINQTADGGFISAGYSIALLPVNYYNTQAILTRLDSTGSVIWSYAYGDTSFHEGFIFARQVADGGFVAAGTISILYPNPRVNSDIIMMKMDASGALLWRKNYNSGSQLLYGGCRLSSCRQTSDGGFILVGGSNDLFDPETSTLLIKTDSAGVLLWAKLLGSGGTNIAESVIQTSDNGYIIAGICDTTQFSSGPLQITLTKTDSAGNLSWSEGYGVASWDGHCSVKQTPDSGFMMAATFFDTTNSKEIRLIRTNASGNLLWSKTISGPGLEQSAAVEITSDNGYLILGTRSDSLSGPRYTFLMKMDAAGTVLWSHNYETGYGNETFTVKGTFDNGYIISGVWIHPFTGYGQAWLIKTDSAGISGCNESSPSIPVINAFPVATPVQLTSDSTGGTFTMVSPVNSGVQEFILCTGSSVNAPADAMNSVTVYPNPFTSEISIAFHSLNLYHSAITIKNILGQVVYCYEENNLCNDYTKTINLGFLSEGVYLLDVNIDGKRTVKKIIKEK